jgi:hypothetical protein
MGNVGREEFGKIWDGREFTEFRKRVLKFDFPPCIHCNMCDLIETNMEDCFENRFPVCGDCLWARGVILCP